MINEVQSLMGEYTAWLRDKTMLRQLDGDWVEVTTPFLDRHNDHLQIYVRKAPQGLLLTDDAYTIQDLENSGCDLTATKRKDLLRSVLNGFGVQREGDALTVIASPQDFARKKHRLIQAMLAVNDLFFTAPTTVATLFFEDVGTWLTSEDVRYIPAVKLTGSSGYDHTFDFVIPASRVAPERVVQTINRPSRDRVEAAAFAWIDTHEARRRDSRAYVFLNDTDGRLPRGGIGALATYGIKSVLWSERDAVRDELAA